MDSNSNYMLKTTFFSEVRKVTKKFRRVDTQGDRAELISDLKVILDVYKKHVAKTVKAARVLLEAGFEYVTDMDDFKIFRKRK